MRRLRKTLLALVLVGGVQVAGATPAVACSCYPGGRTDAAAAKEAKAVFTGTLLSNTLVENPASEVPGSDPIVLTFAVDGVYKGEIAATQDVVTAAPTGGCGMGPGSVGAGYVVFAHPAGGIAGLADIPGWSLFAALCDGTRLLSQRPAEAGLGVARAPAAGTLSAAFPPLKPTATERPVPAAQSAAQPAGSSSRTAYTIGVLAVFGIVLVVLTRVPRRRREHGSGL